MRAHSLLFLLLIPLFCYSQKQANKSEPAFTALLAQFPQVRDWTMSPNGQEAYFTVTSAKSDLAVILQTRLGKFNNWNDPTVARFSGRFKDLEPALSPDGLRLFFATNRNTDQTDTKPDMDIWYVERRNLTAAWSEPIRLPEPVNTTADEFYPSVAANGNLYFTAVRSGAIGKEDIFISKWNGERYENPIALTDNINSTGYEFNSYISSDESFIIYTAYGREDDLGRGDLYISYKNHRGEWTPAQHLGDGINSNQLDYCPFYFAPTQTLYFTSERSQLGNTQERIIDIQELLKVLYSPENGKGSIYKVDFPLTSIQIN